MWEGGFFRGAFAIALQGLGYIGTRRDATWASLMAMDLTRRAVEASDMVGYLFEVPEREEVSRIFKQLTSSQDAIAPELPWHAQTFLTFSSRDEAKTFGWVWRLGDYRQGLALFSRRARESEDRGRIALASFLWARTFLFHTALGEFDSARNARQRSASLATRLPHPSFLTSHLIVCEDDWRMAVDDAWDAPLEDLGPGLAQVSEPWLRVQLRSAKARTDARMGRADRALRGLAEILWAIDRAPDWAPSYVKVTCDAAETLWLTGQTTGSEVIERNLHEKVVGPDFHQPMTDGRLALARLSALRGRFDEALEWFAKARTVLDAQGARPQRAIVDYDEALMYARRARDGDREQAVPLLEAALTQFRAIGMPGWIRRAEHLLATGKEWSPATDAASAPADQKGPESGAQKPGTTDQEPATCVLRCEGDVWAIAFAGTTHRIRDSRGLQYLALLFAHPGREFHAGEIVALSNAPAASERTVRTEELRVADLGDAGALLDATATAQYKRRLESLRDELREAEVNNDIGRRAHLREEIDALVSALAGAGRGRRAASHAERARSAVSKRIRAALKQIAAVDPQLGRHLHLTVHTGTFCSYRPAPALQIDALP